MSFIQNLFTSRDNNANAATYIGQQDRLWYNPITQTLYVSDGSTPGGIPVNLATGANITANVITVNTLTSSSGTIAVSGSLNIAGNISPAGNNKIGGIFPGPGVVIGTNGQLTIDSANLPVSFGNFFATNNILSIVNVDENMILETQGNAEVQLVGNIGFYKSDGATPSGQYFYANKDGQIFMYVPTTDTTYGAVEIIGSTTGNSVPPGLGGAMLHVTGQIDNSCRVYFDGNGDYVAINGRSWRGNIASGIQAIQAGNDVLRINATAATSAGLGNVAFAQIRYTAIENQTPTAQGSNINFWTTAAGSNASSRIEVANISVANGVSATKFTTSGIISATGNINSGNVLTSGAVSATGNITGGNISGTNGTFTKFTGKYIRNLRDAGLIADGGTLTINFSTDAIVYCTWANGMTMAYQNYTAGSVVKVMATKVDGSGTDTLNLDGVTANQTSSGSTTVTGTAGTTVFLEYTCTGTTLGSVFVKI